MVRLIGSGWLALALTTPGWAADHYVEVWNPPEARAPAAHAPAAPAARAPSARAHDAHAGAAAAHGAATQKLAAKPPRKRHVVQTVKTDAHRTPAPGAAPAARPAEQPAAGKLIVMQPALPDAPRALDNADIPRQYTPDGNVLRVGTRSAPAEVTR
ncbi:hypothetical protein C5O80_24835 [Burkholderia sp. SRS-46]|nr:hypothetical protein C5O80_24835 [Burkholderia sp. SRS-46]